MAYLAAPLRAIEGLDGEPKSFGLVNNSSVSRTTNLIAVARSAFTLHSHSAHFLPLN